MPFHPADAQVAQRRLQDRLQNEADQKREQIARTNYIQCTYQRFFDQVKQDRPDLTFQGRERQRTLTKALTEYMTTTRSTKQSPYTPPYTLPTQQQMFTGTTPHRHASLLCKGGASGRKEHLSGDRRTHRCNSCILGGYR